MKRRSLSLLLTVFLLHGAPVLAQGRNDLQDPQAQQGNPTREFVMSCTYGVLAGTLVGTASLAFTSKPSDSLNRVARGASLGLYTGILLGLYVVYVVPGMTTEEEVEDPVVNMWPVFEGGELAGAEMSVNVLRF